MNELIVFEIQTRDVVKPRSEFITYTELMKIYSSVKDTDIISFIESEEGLIRGKRIQFNRLYVRKKDRSVDGVGWILNCDIEACIICGSEFNSSCLAYHCVACGNIICEKCSDQAIITEMTELDEQTVCTHCCWGQPHVDAVLRPNGEIKERSRLSSDKTSYVPSYTPFSTKASADAPLTGKQAAVAETAVKKLQLLVQQKEKDRKDGGADVRRASMAADRLKMLMQEKERLRQEEKKLQRSSDTGSEGGSGANSPNLESPGNRLDRTKEDVREAVSAQSTRIESERQKLQQKKNEERSMYEEKRKEENKRVSQSMDKLRRLTLQKEQMREELKRADENEARLAAEKKEVMQKKEVEREQQQLLKEQEVLAAKEKRNSIMLKRKENEQTPQQGFVVKTCLISGGGVFVNFCSHLCVSDVVSSQGIIGCPYLIVSEGKATGTVIELEGDENILVYNVVMHPKYVLATTSSHFIARKQKLVSYALSMINQTYPENGVINDKRFSFPEVENSYIGDEISSFNIPYGMPSFVEFDTMKITPTPGLVLKCKMLSDGTKVFVNVCWDNKAPNFPLKKMYMYVGPEKAIQDKDNSVAKVYDVLLHTSVWLEVQNRSDFKEKMFAKILLAIGMHACGDLDTKCTTPITRNNYKGDQITSIDFGGAELAPSALPPNAFQEMEDIRHGLSAFSADSASGEPFLEMTAGNLSRSKSSAAIFSNKQDSASVNSDVTSTTASKNKSKYQSLLASSQGKASMEKGDKQNWTQFLNKNEKVLAMAGVVQQKSFGVASKRQLILTNGPRLMYVNPKTQVMVVVPWKPHTRVVNTSTCELVGQKFTFSDSINGAQFWADHIERLE